MDCKSEKIEMNKEGRRSERVRTMHLGQTRLMGNTISRMHQGAKTKLEIRYRILINFELIKTNIKLFLNIPISK